MRLFLSTVCLHTNWNEINQVHCVRAEKVALISIFCTLSRGAGDTPWWTDWKTLRSHSHRGRVMLRNAFLSPLKLIAKERESNHRVNIAATPKKNVLIINLSVNVLFHVLLVIRLSANVADCLDMTKKLTFALWKVTKKKENQTHEKSVPDKQRDGRQQHRLEVQCELRNPRHENPRGNSAPQLRHRHWKGGKVARRKKVSWRSSRRDGN